MLLVVSNKESHQKYAVREGEGAVRGDTPALVK